MLFTQNESHKIIGYLLNIKSQIKKNIDIFLFLK